MTAHILQATPFVELVAPELRTACRRFLNALDAFAEAKAGRAVPEHELRRAQREIDRYRRLMHPDRKLRAKTATAGR
jgi:hypothetical protein